MTADLNKNSKRTAINRRRKTNDSRPYDAEWICKRCIERGREASDILEYVVAVALHDILWR